LIPRSWFKITRARHDFPDESRVQSTSTRHTPRCPHPSEGLGQTATTEGPLLIAPSPSPSGPAAHASVQCGPFSRNGKQVLPFWEQSLVELHRPRNEPNGGSARRALELRAICASSERECCRDSVLPQLAKSAASNRTRTKLMSVESFMRLDRSTTHAAAGRGERPRLDRR
jgi:hypothetical protein